jgi:hypothetical protein
MRTCVVLLGLVLIILLPACASNKQENLVSQPISNSLSVQPKQSPEAIQKVPAKLAVTPEQKTKYTCKKASDERVLEAVNLDKGSCEVKYTKAGKTNSVASSTHGMKHCLKVVGKMESKLAKAGFTCE